MRGDETQEPNRRENRRAERQDHFEEGLRVSGPIDFCCLIKVDRHRVEEALHQPRVHAHRTTEVDQNQSEVCSDSYGGGKASFTAP